ncbi:5'-nucleotidase SurE @ Exopolyphosphatase [hydrothermal vent metagenome]|uniref:5'-nucleotidase n=1 Tax=hydrothermal vent metagenome TaxID=652676 RepID=A0A3B0XIJ1_9ZZZZ
MQILLSNDDGHLAPGLAIMAKCLSSCGTLSVVVPDRNRSAASNSLTLSRPLNIQQSENGFYRVDGTPTDCVHLAITGILPCEPDIVISGPNDGPNMGDDVLYSGTVAAATEGRFLGFPAIAVSMASFNPQYFETACWAVEKILLKLQQQPLKEDTILNINVPDLPQDKIKGFKSTRLGNRHKSSGVIKQINPRDETVYWVGPPGEEQDAGEGTDFHAVKQGFISVTPLQIDLTRYDSLQNLNQWLEGL